MLAQRRRRRPCITTALGQYIMLSGVSGTGMDSVTRITMQQSETRYNHPMLFQCRASVENCGSTLKQHWVNATCLRKVYSRPSDGLALSKRLRRLTGIEPAMVCDAGQHWTGSWLVGLHPLYEVHRKQVLNECWPAPAMVVEGIHVENIF